MEITQKLIAELQNRLKVGSRRGVHLNAIPSNSRYKFDLTRLSYIDKNLPNKFIKSLLTEQPLKFRISWKDNVPDLNSLFEEEQSQIVKITKSFENLINQTSAIESEKGINTFGFGFPLLVRRDQSDKKLTVAPILIWSLRITKSKEFNTWIINRDEDDPIYINEVLINHLQNDSKVELEQLDSDFLDDGLIDKDELLDICERIIETINGNKPDDLRNIFNEKLKNINPISDKKHYEKLPLTSNNSFIDFGGLFSIFEVQKQNIIHDYGSMLELENTTIDLEDMVEHEFQPISSVETDPSQQGILHSLETTRNILIQGPPGTGKSQSLTAILVNALENHKKTIVVCEKRTALEVLEKSLNDKGLNYQCVLIKDIVKDRKVVVNSVRDRIDNSSYRRYSYMYSKHNLDNIIQKAKSLINSINKKHDKIGEKITGSKNWTTTVGELLSQLKDNNEDYQLEFENNVFKYDSSELVNLLELIRKAQLIFEKYEKYEKESFLNQAKLIGENPFIIEQDISLSFKEYKESVENIRQETFNFYDDYKNIRSNEIIEEVVQIGKEIQAKVDLIISIDSISNEIKANYVLLRQKEFNKQLDLIEIDFELINSLFEKYENDTIFLDKIKIHSFSQKVRRIFSSTSKKLKLESEIVELKISEIEKTLVNCKDFEDFKFGESLIEKKQSFYTFLTNLKKLKQQFNEKVDLEFTDFKIESFKNEDINKQTCFNILNEKNNSSLHEDEKSFYSDAIEKLIDIQNQILLQENQIVELFENSSYLKSISFSTIFSARLVELSGLIKKLKSAIEGLESFIQNEINNIDILKGVNVKYKTDSYKKTLNLLSELNDKIKGDDWIIEKLKFESEQDFLKSIEKLIKQKDDYFQNENDLFSIEFKWFQFYNSISDFEKKVVEQLKTKKDWKKVFLTYYLNSLLIKSATNDLPTNDDDHEELKNSLSNLEKEQLKYIKDYWFSKQVDASKDFDGNFNNLSVENLYNKKAGSKHRRLSLRQIVDFDIDLFTTFFPIILTTPDVCSNLFKGNNKYFDIVMFDEASQLKLEDNLPALLKGKQVIIAGDEHQMPPSNYFSKIFDGSADDFDDDDDETADKLFEDGLLSAESLLEFAEELNFEKKYLDFHYRSKHPYLIDFSNYAFYNKRLKPLPNSFEYTPIKYINVNGVYSEHTNEAEAETVLSIIENNINRLPNGKYPSVGVATFNIHQRNLILNKINDRRKFNSYSDFNDKIIELEEDGFFVKNLENIQGDERDIIILTTTYGINKENKFTQRFGSINHEKGYKLLNVIVTRAKYKIYVCSSIPEEVFLNYKEYLFAEGSNNRRAVFFAYLAYSKAVSENNNEERLSILNTLSENTNQSKSIDILNNNLESPFEEEVYNYLLDYFDKNKIIPQYEFSGFRIDLVYDSKIPGIPKIAIECDGASYHSSQEAYLYDRHRQKILESHGFVFHRIWSTNWWRSPKKEINNLVNFIKSIENSNPVTYEDNSKIGLAFTDDIDTSSVFKYQSNLLAELDLKETIEIIESKNELEKSKSIINIGDKVKVKYLNNDDVLLIQIVDEEIRKNETQKGFFKVYFKTALANSLIGKSINQTVKIGNLDNYVEVLEIIKKDE